jgi:hypothetical protein
VASVEFPAIRPTGRSYSPGTYPSAEFKALNGATTRMLFGNRRSDAELSLEFQNISDDDAALILEHYERVVPSDDWVSFTNTTGAEGASAALRPYLKENGDSGLRWRYADAPQISSVFRGRSTVQVTFVGQLDAA